MLLWAMLVHVCYEAGQASDAIATHFWFAAVRVENAHGVVHIPFGWQSKYDLDQTTFEHACTYGCLYLQSIQHSIAIDNVFTQRIGTETQESVASTAARATAGLSSANIR
jgi:hypothetical protein